jgi:ATP/maltotriose-dependent transcriptional regulator MalT/DNA-binding SARP family transcriptional activator
VRPPQLAAGVVARPELEATLQRGARRPLVSLVAGAGWGKSTLVARWLADQPAAWYRVDAEDRDPQQLAAGLATAVATTSGRPLPTRPTGSDPGALGAALLAGWADDGPVRVVLDDVQQLRGSAGLELVRTLVGTAGPHLQLVLLAADDLDLIDARHRAAGTVLELDAANLAMGADAVAELLDTELDPDPALAARLADVTGGWPAAIRLLIESLRAVPAEARSGQVSALAGAGGPIAGYLLAVVLPTLDPAVRRTLLQVALLGTVSIETLATVTGEPVLDLATRLRAAVRRGLVRWSPTSSEGEVELAPVLRRVLRSWDDPAHGSSETLVTELVDGLLAAGEGGRALEVLTATGRTADVVEVLAHHGDALLGRGEVLAVERAAASVTPAERTPTVDRLHGHALAYRGEWSAALACLAAAGAARGGAAHGGAMPLPTELALPLGLTHHLRGDLGAAADAYGRAPDDERTATHAVLRSWRATCHWLRGERDEARHHADQALSLAEQLEDDHALAHAHTAQALVAASDGDRRGNAGHYRQALTAAERAGDRLQQARIRTNLGSHHLEDGRYDDAKRETDRAIDLASALGYTPILGVAWCNRAEISLRTGALDQAIADATTARELFARIDSRNESYAEHLLGDARREQGELVLARVAYERAIRLVGRAGDHQGLVPAHIGLAKTLASTDPDRAAEVAARALALDGGMERAQALLAGAWVELARGDHDRVRTLATEALEDAERREDPVAVAEAVTCLALVADDPTAGLRAALRRWQEVHAPLSTARVELGLARRSDRADERAHVASLERRLLAWGCPPDGGAFPHRAVAAVELRPRTSIRVLGGFVVERSGRPVPRAAWGSRKARDLLKVLVVRAGRRISREQLADLLWPDEPYEEVTNRLSVALSVVRSVLAEGDASRDAGPIRTVDDAIELDGDAVDIDLVRFEELADEGERAARSGDVAAAVVALTAAEEAYGGDLLEDDLESTWVVDRREALRSRYVSVARTLAGFVVEDDPDHALRLLLRVLDRDGYDEPAHLEVCRALLRAGRHGEARRRHRIYADRMTELELPAIDLHELARSVLRASSDGHLRVAASS